MPAHGSAVNTPPEPTPTRSLHQDTQHPGWQGLRTCTGHPGGGTLRIVSHVTDRDNPDGCVLQQPADLRRDVRCGAPIPRRWSTRQRVVGVVRPAQRVGDQVHALPRAERGDLQDRVEGVICGVSAWGGNSIGCGVDGGGGAGFGIANEPHWD